MYRIAESNELRPRGFYWKRRFPNKAVAVAAVERFFKRNPFTQSSLRVCFDKRNV